MYLVTAILAASICRAVNQVYSSALIPNDPKARR